MTAKKQNPFRFVLDELSPLRPVVKQMFGFTHVYLDEKLLLSLRYSEKEPRFNGVWLYTQAEHLDALRAEFPSLPKHRFWKSGKKGWIILTTKGEDFEEYAFKACEMILKGDQRFGRISRKR
jgi:hypothetical protein